MTKNAKDIALEAVILEFYRKEIRLRYQIDQMRQVDEFDPIPDETLEALRDFFLDRMYPPKETRAQLDAAYDELGNLLRSPKRLAALLRHSWMSMLRLGPQLPSAVSAGIAVISALRETRKLEAAMLDVAHRLKLTPAGAGDRQTMLRLIAGVPEKTVMALINDIVGLFDALSHVKMLTGMLRVLEQCLEGMERNPDAFTEEERAGLALGIETLRGGRELVMQVKPKDLPRVTKGIEHIELAWYDRVRKEAG